MHKKRTPRKHLDLEQYHALRKKGLTICQAAKELGFAQSTLRYKLQEFGAYYPTSKFKYKTLDKDQFLALKAQGLTNKEISHKLGMHANTLSRKLKAYNVMYTWVEPRPTLPLDIDEFFSLRNNGYKNKEIASILGMSLDTLQARLRENSLRFPYKPPTSKEYIPSS